MLNLHELALKIHQWRDATQAKATITKSKCHCAVLYTSLPPRNVSGMGVASTGSAHDLPVLQEVVHLMSPVQQNHDLTG